MGTPDDLWSRGGERLFFRKIPPAHFLKLIFADRRLVAGWRASLNNAGGTYAAEYTENMTQERVLIVEDEENERTGLAELISGWGYRTDTAADGVEALEKIPAFAPSIVITDVKMPRMGGMELVERLADLAQSIAVIMVTAQKATDTAFHAGIPRPFAQVAVGISKTESAQPDRQRPVPGADQYFQQQFPNPGRYI